MSERPVMIVQDVFMSLSESEHDRLIRASNHLGLGLGEYVRQQLQSVIAPVKGDPPVPGVDYKAGWCDIPDCPCTQAGRVCEEFMGSPETGAWCPRCGWHASHHTAGVSPNGCRTLWPSEVWVHVKPGCRCHRRTKR